MTTSHDLAAMTDEQFTTHLLRQAMETQIRDMRDDAAFMDRIEQTAAAMALRRHADRLEASLNHTGVVQR